MPLPELPDQLTPEQSSIDQRVSANAEVLQQVGQLRFQLKPIAVRPKVSSAIAKPPRKQQRPAPVPPLTLPMQLIGVVLSDSRSVAVLQARDQRLYTLSEGDSLPVPHQAMQVDTIEAATVTFRQGQRTIRIEVEPRLP